MKSLESAVRIPPGGALDGSRHRVIVSTDIGGTDPDDFQSMVHFLLYADLFDVEGLISSSGLGGGGRVSDIYRVIDAYEKDYAALLKKSSAYPTPEGLRVLTKQGETEIPPYEGVSSPTEGSRWIVACARRDDPRPLHILGWGGIEDIAQALHDAPDILPKLRVHWIGGPNKKWGPHQYQYVADNHPDLWIIESNATYRGWFTGGDQTGYWGNKEFVERAIAPHGALGSYFASLLGGSIKMGDTPTVAWLLKGNPEDPAAPGWGGQFVRAWERPYLCLDRLPGADDRMEIFGIMEISLSLPDGEKKPGETILEVENQNLPGSFHEDRTVRFRFCPKAPRHFHFTLRSPIPEWDGKKGTISVHLPASEAISRPCSFRPYWWTDTPLPDLAEGEHHGARTVSRWRRDFLADFAERLEYL